MLPYAPALLPHSQSYAPPPGQTRGASGCYPQCTCVSNCTITGNSASVSVTVRCRYRLWARTMLGRANSASVVVRVAFSPAAAHGREGCGSEPRTHAHPLTPCSDRGEARSHGLCPVAPQLHQSEHCKLPHGFTWRQTRGQVPPDPSPLAALHPLAGFGRRRLCAVSICVRQLPGPGLCSVRFLLSGRKR